jgi:hypothetical protein
MAPPEIALMAAVLIGVPEEPQRRHFVRESVGKAPRFVVNVTAVPLCGHFLVRESRRSVVRCLDDGAPVDSVIVDSAAQATAFVARR